MKPTKRLKILMITNAEIGSRLFPSQQQRVATNIQVQPRTKQ